MNVLFIANGIGLVGDLPGISGGDVRWIEIARKCQEVGWNIHVLTPEPGKKLCEMLALDATFHINRVANEYSLKTYLLRFLRSGSIPRTLTNFEGIVYSTTEHLYDVLPALKIKEKSKHNIWVAVVHWVAPLKRKETSFLNSILFFHNQRLGFHYIRNGADVVLAVSENTAEQVKRIGIMKNVFKVDAGVDYQSIREISSKVKTKAYSAVFMKRFDGTKGVFDIVEIWRDITRARRGAKLGMIGLGTEEVMKRLKKMVEEYDIVDNVDFLGPIYDFKTKISILASSKLLVLPSYEENWAIVIGEAMAAGVPILCYDLSAIQSIWEDNVVWVPKGHKKKFANKAIDLLDDEQARNRLSEAGMQFIRRYDWREIAEREMTIITNSAENHEVTNK